MSFIATSPCLCVDAPCKMTVLNMDEMDFEEKLCCSGQPLVPWNSKITLGRPTNKELFRRNISRKKKQHSSSCESLDCSTIDQGVSNIRHRVDSVWDSAGPFCGLDLTRWGQLLFPRATAAV
eukprot:Blabericola_migrator_1__11719@NODE_708_length_6780_cov_78_864442_g513_i0_p7_GENE_NODE_708_length_6780_cov_78_864442_g513_i0NODE_708_length_6780_cov_78_864442_g513_i0_p7_ORF_typecomplete_len122_score19_16_NODE_708_length_6780_cov_78_864442_g513_i062946659